MGEGIRSKSSNRLGAGVLIRPSLVRHATPEGGDDLIESNDSFPTILFRNASYWTMEPYLEEICKKLTELNILHPDGRSAAEFLNSIIDDINSWRQSKEVVEIKN